jgi:hypothetical protein
MIIKFKWTAKWEREGEKSGFSDPEMGSYLELPGAVV